MGVCDYCGTDTANTWSDNIDSALHKSCSNEKDRRKREKLCVFCNNSLGPKELDLNDIKHERCRQTGVYSEYPYQ